MPRFHEPWAARIIAKRTPQLLHARGQCVVANSLSVPQSIDELLLGDDLHRSLRQCGQQPRCPRSKFDFVSASPELPSTTVKSILADGNKLRAGTLRGTSPEFCHYLWLLLPDTRTAAVWFQ
jgi:hypothetical protein